MTPSLVARGRSVSRTGGRLRELPEEALDARTQEPEKDRPDDGADTGRGPSEDEAV